VRAVEGTMGSNPTASAVVESAFKWRIRARIRREKHKTRHERRCDMFA
jgi:hypothetical protein